MAPADLLHALRQRPFIPFRLHVSDGTVHTIRHPESLLIGLSSAIVGISDNPDTPTYTRTETVDMRHIVRIVPIEGHAPPSFGGNASQP